MAVGSELLPMEGYPFEVRYSDGALVRATAAAEVAADAYVYFSRLFSAVEPDIAVVVADEADWPGNHAPYGLGVLHRGRSVLVPAPGGGDSGWMPATVGSFAAAAASRGWWR